MYNKIFKFLTKNKLIYKNQFGFQKNTSTEHAILRLVDHITKSFSEGKFTLGVFIDLSKAFDTVDHSILLNKLEYYGINGVTKKWFESYLKNRKQCVAYDNGKVTELLDVTCGVPQGSILGPLLFLIYVNDLYKASNELTPIMFADDTNIFISDKNIPKLFLKMKGELEKLSVWFKANKLSINVKKTKYSIFHPTNKKKYTIENLPKLKLDDIEITRDFVTKFLGVMIDETLSWKPHIDSVSTKVSKNIGILYRANFILNRKLMKKLYYSFIHSYLSYGNIAWGSTYKTNLLSLYRHQKHALRIITNSDRFTHSHPLFKELKILNIYEINVFQILYFILKCKLKLSPPIFHGLFTLKPASKYEMRSDGVLLEPLCKTRQEQFNICYRAPHLWNNLIIPNKIFKDIETLSLFKNTVKEILLANENILNFF